VDVLDRVQQFGTRRALEHITGRARRQRLENVVGILIHGEHHELCVQHLRLEPADTFNATHAGQIDIHQDDGGLFLRQRDQRGLGICMDTNALETVRAADPLGQDIPDLRVLFDDGNSNADGLYSSPIALGKIAICFYDASVHKI